MIQLDHIAKRYQQHWIFKNVHLSFKAGGHYALLGANGSGKSTLLRCIIGVQSINKGKIIYEIDGKIIEQDKIYPYVAYCAPGMDIIQEMTLVEFLKFHFQFKKTIQNISIKQMIEESGLKGNENKLIMDFSSGMLQRVKLMQAFYADTPIICLDEPCSNLDQKGYELYHTWVTKYVSPINRTLIVATNDPAEHTPIMEKYDITAYKTI